MPPPPLTFPLPSRTSAPQPSLFQVFLDESCYNYYQAVVQIIFDFAFFGICRALPHLAVSAKQDVRRFLKEETTKISSFCVSVLSFFLHYFVCLCAFITCSVWPRPHQSTPPPFLSDVHGWILFNRVTLELIITVFDIFTKYVIRRQCQSVSWRWQWRWISAALV